MDSGVWIYAYYRLFSKLSHGRLGLNDEYLQQVPHSPEAPSGLHQKIRSLLRYGLSPSPSK